MHQSKIAFLATACMGIIATFLPWEKIAVMGVVSESLTGINITESVLGSKGVGWVSLVLFAMVVILVCTGKRTQPIPAVKKWIMMIMGLCAAIIGVHTYMDVQQKAILNPQENGGLSFESSAAMGIYIVIAAGAALILLGFFLKGKKDGQNKV